MPALIDPIRLAAYKDALRNWHVTDYVKFDLTSAAERWVTREFGLPMKAIASLMFEYVASGGEIDEVKEKRPEWADHEYHYDLRFVIRNKAVYIETRLFYREPLVPDESRILVVNIHER